MKGKRQKHQKRCLTFYKNFFQYQPPYSVLIDGTFCKAALKFKVNIRDQLPKYLDAEIKYFTTKCVLAECEALGTLLYGPLKVLRQFHVQPCKHDTAVAAPVCLRSVLRRHKHKFMVATQDPEFSEVLHTLSGVPRLFIAFNAITIEEPADMSKQIAKQKLEQKVAPSDYAMSVIKDLKLEVFGNQEEVKRKKKKKPKGPNPLSCKKKKKRSEEDKQKKKKKKKKKIKTEQVTLASLVSSEKKS